MQYGNLIVNCLKKYFMENVLSGNKLAKKLAVGEERKEGPVAKAIEKQTSKLPSDLFLWTSLAAMGTALAFKLFKKDHVSLFVGQWVAPILLMGVYNKIVKTEGHDKDEK